MRKAHKLCRRVLGTPSGLTLALFLLSVPGFWLYRLALHTENFLADPGKEMLFSTIAGSCACSIVYVILKRKQAP
jgi:hypothetical protein